MRTGGRPMVHHGGISGDEGSRAFCTTCCIGRTEVHTFRPQRSSKNVAPKTMWLELRRRASSAAGNAPPSSYCRGPVRKWVQHPTPNIQHPAPSIQQPVSSMGALSI